MSNVRSGEMLALDYLEERPDPRESRRRSASQERVPLTVRLLVDTTESFVRTYYPDVMQGGMFIRTNAPQPLQLGTRVMLRFLARDGSEVFGGSGIVAWVQRTGDERGLGLQFLRLTPDSHLAYREMLRRKRALDARRRAALQHEFAPGANTAKQEWCEAPTRQMPRKAARTAPRRERLTPRRARRLPPPIPPRNRPRQASRSSELSEKIVIPIDG